MRYKTLSIDDSMYSKFQKLRAELAGELQRIPNVNETMEFLITAYYNQKVIDQNPKSIQKI